MPKVQLKKRHIIFTGVLVIIGLGIYGITQVFDYYYNIGGTITLEPGKYQHWFLPDSHQFDLQRPRWKGLTYQDTFSVYFSSSPVIESLIANFTDSLPLDAFSEYLLANETYYFNSWISITSAGNWSIIMINPHTYAISVENSLTGLIYPYNLYMVLFFGIAVGSSIITYVKSNGKDSLPMQSGNEEEVTSQSQA